MSTVQDNAFATDDKAKNWLEKLPCSPLRVELDSYPNGPIFECKSSEATVNFLLKCSTYEASRHRQDEEMNGVVLTVEFEFGTMHANQLELAFAFSDPEQDGSTSFSVSTTKCPNGFYKVFGDEEFRHLA